MSFFELDSFIRSWIVMHRLAALDGPMLALSIVGRGGALWLIAGLWLAVRKRWPWRSMLTLVLTVLLTTTLVDHLMKPIIARERPFARLLQDPAATTSDPDVIGGRPTDKSFPSGHAANSFASAFVFSRLAASRQILWWTLAALITFSRLYLGVHYPLDVIGGAVIGTACAALVMRLRRAAERPSS